MSPTHLLYLATGFANSEGEVSRAGFLASQVRGVRSVKNDSRLKTG